MVMRVRILTFAILCAAVAEGARILGDCKDEHGCVLCAGYVWDAAANVCMQVGANQLNA